MPDTHDLRFSSPKSRPNLDPNSLRGSNPKMPACVGMLCLTSPFPGYLAMLGSWVIGIAMGPRGIDGSQSTSARGTFSRNLWSPLVYNHPPSEGATPTVDLVLGYRKTNQSPILRLLLSRLDELVTRVSNKTR